MSRGIKDDVEGSRSFESDKEWKSFSSRSQNSRSHQDSEGRDGVGHSSKIQGDRHVSEERRAVSITEAAKINNVTRQAIYVAIKQKKLRAYKKIARWTIDLDDLAAYRRDRYSRSKSMYNGKLLFDNSKGYYSVGQTARLLNLSAQRIYYATRVGHLGAERRGSSWVIHIKDIEKYQREHVLGNRRRLLKAG
ncbi:helix-turn-helix domain-containing protein [Candidatus Similichlamydia epinepheli]|uniref:helix-turn-helix domain-containing protein n=1 Tax=Candidatus Similichlamydia epinepheli TaxID=1903953 RepID=UPI000D35E9DA|nr:helix-turn-helix domain-containing protein [Candidatus Similichlamydia epinepheli]